METRMEEVDPLADGRPLFEEAARVLSEGGLVALPTETVYGLGADALNAEAVARVFEVKQRPSFDPLIVHLSHAKELSKVASIPSGLEETVGMLARLFWPGPLTMVLPKTDVVPDIVTSGLDTVAVRVSSHPVMRGVIKALGHPVAAPSANRFGRISPTSAGAVMKELGGSIELVLDAGACSEGLESTIVRPVFDEKGKPAVELLREGPVTREQFRNVIKVIKLKKPRDGDQQHPVSPGRLESHYAPGKPFLVVEDAAEFIPEQGVRYGLLSFKGDSALVSSHDWASVVVLSPGSGRLAEASVRLFALMRQLDENENIDVIVAEPVPKSGLGYAIMDRMSRAAQAHSSH